MGQRGKIKSQISSSISTNGPILAVHDGEVPTVFFRYCQDLVWNLTEPGFQLAASLVVKPQKDPVADLDEDFRVRVFACVLLGMQIRHPDSRSLSHRIQPINVIFDRVSSWSRGRVGTCQMDIDGQSSLPAKH